MSALDPDLLVCGVQTQPGCRDVCNQALCCCLELEFRKDITYEYQGEIRLSQEG